MGNPSAKEGFVYHIGKYKFSVTENCILAIKPTSKRGRSSMNGRDRGFLIEIKREESACDISII